MECVGGTGTNNEHRFNSRAFVFRSYCIESLSVGILLTEMTIDEKIYTYIYAYLLKLSDRCVWNAVPRMIETEENERDEKKMSKAKTLNVASYDFVIDL